MQIGRRLSNGIRLPQSKRMKPPKGGMQDAKMVSQTA
jgi:hypothetical protein